MAKEKVLMIHASSQKESLCYTGRHFVHIVSQFCCDISCMRRRNVKHDSTWSNAARNVIQEVVHKEICLVIFVKKPFSYGFQFVLGFRPLLRERPRTQFPN